MPFASCIMPTHGRRDFVGLALRYFERRQYAAAELIVIDDGPNPVSDLVAGRPGVRYHRLPDQIPLGAKRNLACEMARGTIILHWDDDDWMAPWRIGYQVEGLMHSGADACGLDNLLYFDPAAGDAWQYVYPPQSARPWVAGGTLCYTKSFWSANPFAEINVGEDGQFIWGAKPPRIFTLQDNRFYIAIKHQGNTSPKITTSSLWRPYPPDQVAEHMNADLGCYRFLNPSAANRPMPVREPQMSEPAKVDPRAESAAATTFAIIMVVHNAREIVKIATLRSLQHSRGCHARLVVVDNGSTDGIEHWLKMLAGRGDIQLIRNTDNRGHGPGLEQGRGHSASRFIVTLDSDAFPLNDNWLETMRSHLTGKVKIVGIGHHRDYIHPACLMIERETLDRFTLDFRDEKHLPSNLDVAERISCDIKRRGFEIRSLKRTGALRRGSRSEPVFLGSDYEGLVHHQWYSSRAALAPGLPVDDVAPADLQRSWEEVISAFHDQPRPLTVVMGLSVQSLACPRWLNAKAVLGALNHQDLPRWHYRIVVVEQGPQPILEKELAPLADRYLFAPNPGPYNRSWGLNIGAMLKGSKEGILCLTDADLLVPPGFLRKGLAAFQSGSLAFLPFEEVLYLDKDSTRRLIEDHPADALDWHKRSDLKGQLFNTSQGGCIWVDARLYRRIGGHDEGFRGWGYEDRAFIHRLKSASSVRRLPGRLLHLFHPPAPTGDAWAEANRRYYEKLLLQPGGPKHGPMGDRQRFSREAPAPDAPPFMATAGRRDWEHWHRWHPRRIEQIVLDEKALPATQSMRRRLADVAVQFGDTLLDVGCGAGAVWEHLAGQNRPLRCMGMDVTWKMLETARRLFPRVPVCLADASALPFKRQGFEVVLLRHVLEHLPRWLMGQVVCEALRVADKAVLIDFFLPPADQKRDETARVGEGFLQTRWRREEIEEQIALGNGQVHARLGLPNTAEGNDEIWILTPLPLSKKKHRSVIAPAAKKINIIMPTYRRMHTLFGTVAKICSQTYAHWELIVIDNHGDCPLAFSDPRIHVHVHNEVASASYARNHGLNYTTGDLICFFDDDDDMFPDYLESFAAAFEQNPEAKLIRGGMEVDSGQIDYSYATPECCLRRSYASPTWQSDGPEQDQNYYKRIVAQNHWTIDKGDIIMIRKPLCRANENRRGGLRAGRL